MLKQLKINWKITFLSFGIVLFALIAGGGVAVGSILRLQEEEMGRRLLVTARTAAQLPEIAAGIEDKSLQPQLREAAERIGIIHDATYVVVMDMQRIRLAHPVPDRVGTYSSGSDEGPAFAEHSYTSKAKGELGTALRAFVPVMDSSHVQIGTVLVGRILPSPGEVIGPFASQISAVLLLSLLIGLAGSGLLAKQIKKDMFDMEPLEIAHLLMERDATFHAMHEGVIAVHRDERIAVFNKRAREIFHISGDVVGRPIREVLPDTRLPEILELDAPVYQQEIFIGGQHIVSNRVPIRVQGRTVGAVAIFQDRTEVARMAEELTGVKALVETVRVQNHEYMNHMHTIGGLIQLGRDDQALDYLFRMSGEREELNRFLGMRFSDDSLTGLLLGKISRGRELGIDVQIDPHSRLQRFPDNLDHHDFVVLLGNLIENAFDSLTAAVRPGRVFVSLEQDDEQLSLLVEDNGCGMDESVRSRIFERGFSTKAGDGRGIGMHLIAGILEKGAGTIDVESAPGAGTSITLFFPMHGEAQLPKGE
ncbi:two-component system, CitB family, sensor histidine kinase DctS [Paenibacillaceae bacterium GAS479]|nr:two-component system, CitB family, sensor histidine kinase DctS [Paenibacillaceae bacterium GAS479]